MERDKMLKQKLPFQQNPACNAFGQKMMDGPVFTAETEGRTRRDPVIDWMNAGSQRWLMVEGWTGLQGV